MRERVKKIVDSEGYGLESGEGKRTIAHRRRVKVDTFNLDEALQALEKFIATDEAKEVMLEVRGALEEERALRAQEAITDYNPVRQVFQLDWGNEELPLWEFLRKWGITVEDVNNSQIRYGGL